MYSARFGKLYKEPSPDPNGGADDWYREYYMGRVVDHPLFARSLDIYQTGFTLAKAHGKVLMGIKGEPTDETVALTGPKISKARLIAYIRLLKEAAFYLYDRGIVWEDLHGSNVLINGSRFTLIDFGYWKFEGDSKARAHELAKLSRGLVGVFVMAWAKEENEVRIKTTRLKEESSDPITALLASMLPAWTIADIEPDEISSGRKWLANYYDSLIKQIRNLNNENKATLQQQMAMWVNDAPVLGGNQPIKDVTSSLGES